MHPERLPRVRFLLPTPRSHFSPMGHRHGMTTQGSDIQQLCTMSESAPAVKAVIWDLDGTIIDTESLCVDVSRQIVAGHGKSLTQEVIKSASGKRPLEAWADVARLLEMDVDPQQLLDQSEPLLASMWSDARYIPGAMRLLKHLTAHGIPVAVATSTPRSTFNSKLSNKPELKQLLNLVVCGDEVQKGKPHPDIFLAAAKLLQLPPENCVVIEDSVSGVEGAINAGMRVIAVPSQSDHSDYPQAQSNCSAGVCHLLPSLLAFEPESLGLPAFEDLCHGVIPMDEPILIRGTVVKGFGRGSKELGIPTANVDSDSLHASLAEAVTGIYAGWASIGSSKEVYKTALSIGYNPHFGNAHKTCEPWLLHDFPHDFYGEEIRLLVCGYLRPEAKFTTLQVLIDRILLDGEVSKQALDDGRLSAFAHHAFLAPTGSAPS